MRLVWYQREDGLWNAACACHATICGTPFDQRGDAEAAHFNHAWVERETRVRHPKRFVGNQIPPCGPKLPEENPNSPNTPVFP